LSPSWPGICIPPWWRRFVLYNPGLGPMSRPNLRARAIRLRMGDLAKGVPWGGLRVDGEENSTTP
jgi:hypothetical protein